MRKLLAVDTSGPVCGVAVLDGEKVLSEIAAQNRNTHSASLMPMVERALDFAGVSLRDLDALAAVTGPGSFTGIRIGVATVKAMAHGSGKPCVSVDALEALAESTGRRGEDLLICPLQDARAGQVYCALFRGEARLTENAPLKLADCLARLDRFGTQPVLFTGDGMTVHRDRIREIMGERALFPEAAFCWLRPAAAGALALRKGTPVAYPDLKESYLRPPNAEKNRKLLEAMRHE